MKKITFENYIYEDNGSIRKFQTLTEEEKKRMYAQMMRILQERTNLTCLEELDKVGLDKEELDKRENEL